MSVQVSLVLSSYRPAEFLTDQTPPWRSKIDGIVCNAVAVEGESWGNTSVQGPAAELRRLAAALVQAADEADAWSAANPVEKSEQQGSEQQGGQS